MFFEDAPKLGLSRMTILKGATHGGEKSQRVLERYTHSRIECGTIRHPNFLGDKV